MRNKSAFTYQAINPEGKPTGWAMNETDLWRAIKEYVQRYPKEGPFERWKVIPNN